MSELGQAPGSPVCIWLEFFSTFLVTVALLLDDEAASRGEARGGAAGPSYAARPSPYLHGLAWIGSKGGVSNSITSL